MGPSRSPSIRLKIEPVDVADEDFRLKRKMKLSYEDEELQINDTVTLKGIPIRVRDWQIGGHDALWFLVNYLDPKRKRYFADAEGQDRINDPNDHFENPRDIVAKIEKIVTVAQRTLEIMEGLPRALDEDA